MLRKDMDAHVHYKHTAKEVEWLKKAVEPFHDNVIAVSSGFERGKMKQILGGEYFRRRDAVAMKSMLIRTVKHARASLGDYFPVMREQILINAQALENATVAYWARFTLAAQETTPTH